MASDIDRVLSQIDREELASLVLALCNIDSPSGSGGEKQVAEDIEAWLHKEGFGAKVIGIVPERPHVIGTYKGSGGGYSLLFNSHMDTVLTGEDVWMVRDPKRPILHSAWREGDLLYGRSVINDKGPMACFLMAAKAIKKAGITLKGDLLLTPVSGEIGRDAIDEFTFHRYSGHDVGALP